MPRLTTKGRVMSEAPIEFSLLAQSRVPTRSFVADEVIFRQGDKAEELYVIRSGRVEIRAGHRVVAILDQGDFFGEMALIDPAPRSATAVAATDAQLIPISEKQFLDLVGETPSFALDLLRILVRRLRAKDGYY
jgi:CRP/FNR family transcriptional regulator, cyclic AMP receptor protein